MSDIRTRPQSREYDEGYERIFGKRPEPIKCEPPSFEQFAADILNQAFGQHYSKETGA